VTIQIREFKWDPLSSNSVEVAYLSVFNQPAEICQIFFSICYGGFNLARTSFINALLRIFKIDLSWMIKINALSKKNLIFVWELQGQLEQANKESISSYNKSRALDGNQSILAKTILSHCLKCLIV